MFSKPVFSKQQQQQQKTIYSKDSALMAFLTAKEYCKSMSCPHTISHPDPLLSSEEKFISYHCWYLGSTVES
jgi:hypothetical protein